MRSLDPVPFEMDTDAIFGRLHLDPRSQYADEVHSMIDRARKLARPRAAYEVAFVEERGDDSVVIGQSEVGAEERRARFRSKVLRANLEEVGRVFPYVATCGLELEELSAQLDDMLQKFWADAIKQAALFSAVQALEAYQIERHGLGKTAVMSPGSLEDWPISEQKPLFSIFGDVEELIGVKLTDTFLMLPLKSVSGISFPTEVTFESCQLCPRERCPGRRAAYDEKAKERYFES